MDHTGNGNHAVFLGLDALDRRRLLFREADMIRDILAGLLLVVTIYLLLVMTGAMA